jgi:two-component system CheB/CheR fusion protein
MTCADALETKRRPGRPSSAEAAPEAADVQRRTALEPAATPRRRVVVIEDSIDAAETLREMLLMWDQEVEVAHDGREGLEKVRAFRPDVVLCDIGLPLMDGYAVAREIRADPGVAHVFLVAVTAYALPEDRRRAEEAGFDRHLAKPVPVEEIFAALASVAPGGAGSARWRAPGS